MKRKSMNKELKYPRAREPFNRRYENDLKTASKYLKEHYGSDIIKHQKLSYSFFPRRIKAYSNYAKFICAVAGDRMQALDIEKELSFIGSLPFMTNLDLLNCFFHISFAIAIYILDALKDCGCLSEALMYIPSERDALLSVALPDNFHYPPYSNDLIRGVILLIEGRNQNESVESNNQDVFYSERNSKRNYPITRSNSFSDNVSILMIQSMNYEQRLKCLLSYIPQSVLTKAERNLKEAINHCTVLLLREFEFIESKEYKQGEDAKTRSEEQKTALKANIAFSFIDRNRCGALKALKSKGNRLKIDNPYEICFAAFYLLECKDDDYAWLIELCGIITEMACELLPWYQRPDFSAQAEIIYLCAIVPSLNAVYYRSWNGATDDETDVNHVRDTLSRIVYRKEGYVLPQSDSILKKIQFMRKGIFEILLEFGLFVITAPVLLIIFLKLYYLNVTSVPIALVVLVSLAVCFRNQLHTLNIRMLKRILRKILIRRITKCQEIGFPSNIDHIRSIENTEKELDALSRLIVEQKEELARYKSQIHDAAKTIEEQKFQLDALKAKYDVDSFELAELRDTIYNIQNSIDLEVDVNNIEPHFPYSSKKKIIIIGGHEKWINAMKRYIPNALYINPSSLNFDVTLIKNADVLWLQTNAMPHTIYYKIIDKARSSNIRIKYFSFASAKKCAFEIFMDEAEA